MEQKQRKARVVTMMDFETHERLSLITQVRHTEAKIQFIEERIQHLDKVIRDLMVILNTMDQNINTIAKSKKGIKNPKV